MSANKTTSDTSPHPLTKMALIESQAMSESIHVIVEQMLERGVDAFPELQAIKACLMRMDALVDPAIEAAQARRPMETAAPQGTTALEATALAAEPIAAPPVGVVVVDPRRHHLAYDAAGAIGQLAGPLQFLTINPREGEAEAAHQLAIRLEALAGVILSALGDDDADLDEEQRRLLGPEMYRRAREEASHG